MENSLIQGIITYLLYAIAGFFLALIPIGLLILNRKTREKTLNKLTALKKKFIWNGIIDALTFDFLNQAIYFSIFIQLEYFGAEEQ